MSSLSLFSPWQTAPWLGPFGWGALPPYPVTADDAPAAPPAATGEPTTKEQFQLGGFFAGAASGQQPGYARAPLGSYKIWRDMDRHPTLTLARRLVIGPILAGTRTFEVRQPAGQKKRRTPITGDGVVTDPLDKRAEFLSGALDPLLYDLIRNMLRALSLGHKPFEVVWGVVAGGEAPVRFKPLRNEVTQIMVDSAGAFVGLKNGQEKVWGPAAFNYANEPEDDYWYGTSRHENCREQWWEHYQAKMQGQKLDLKASGITMTVKGPPGTGAKNAAGQPVDGSNAAQTIANEIQQGRPVFMPKFLMGPPDPQRMNDVEYVKAYAELAKAVAFDVEQFDWGNTASQSDAISAKLQYIDVELMRGWHRPEREAMEGTHGTKAEAGTHGQVGVTDCDLVHGDVCRAISCGPVDDTLERVFGADARGSVYLKPAPIQDAQVGRAMEIAGIVTKDPGVAMDLWRKLDKGKFFGALSLATREDVDPNEEMPEPKPVDAPPNGKTVVGVNGNGNGAAGNGNGRMKFSRETETREDLLDRLFGAEDAPEYALALSKDDADGHWVTIDGEHVFIKGGVITKGPAALVGKKPDDLPAGSALHHKVGEETSKGTISLRHEMTGHSHGQSDFYVSAHDATGKEVGRLDYTRYNNELHTKFVEVSPSARRQGLATKMYERMLEEHPDAMLHPAMKTDEGAKFREKFDAAHPDRLYKPVPTPEVHSPEEWKAVTDKYEQVTAKQGHDSKDAEALSNLMNRMNDYERIVHEWHSGSRADELPTKPDVKAELAKLAAVKHKAATR